MRYQNRPTLPSTDDVRTRLKQLSFAEIRALCKDTGAPFTTVWKVREGETVNPGLETVRSFWPALLKATKQHKGSPAITVEA